MCKYIRYVVVVYVFRVFGLQNVYCCDCGCNSLSASPASTGVLLEPLPPGLLEELYLPEQLQQSYKYPAPPQSYNYPAPSYPPVYQKLVPTCQCPYRQVPAPPKCPCSTTKSSPISAILQVLAQPAPRKTVCIPKADWLGKFAQWKEKFGFNKGYKKCQSAPPPPTCGCAAYQYNAK